MFECQHCGRCCLQMPCKFAQTRYGAGHNKPCPDLIKEGDKYRCLLMDKEPEIKTRLLSGECDAPYKYSQQIQPDFSALREKLIKVGYAEY